MQKMVDWRYYGTCTVAVFFGFVLRYYQEKRRSKKVDVKFQMVASIVISYVAYILYRDRKLVICSIEIWLFFWSYFGSLTITVSDQIFVNGWKIYLRNLAKQFIAYSDKDKNQDDDDIE
jgi:hypothetical protein